MVRTLNKNLQKISSKHFMIYLLVTDLFNDDAVQNANKKLASKSISMVMLKKMQTERLQGRLLELKNELIRSGVRQVHT